MGSGRTRLIGAAVLVMLLVSTVGFARPQYRGNRTNTPRGVGIPPRGAGSEAQALLGALAQAAPGDRDAIADKLALLGAPAIPALAMALQNPNADVRLHVVEVLGRIQDRRRIDPLALAVGDEDAGVRALAAGTLAKVGPLGLRALVAALQQPDPEVQARVGAALTEIGKPALPFLSEALRNPQYQVRAAAVKCLGGIRDPNTVGPLIRALDDRNPDVRLAAVEALADRRGPGVIRAMAKVFADGDQRIRTAAATSLRSMRDPNAIGPLTGALNHPDPEVRSTAVEALADIPDGRAVNVVTAALHRPDPVVRSAAATRLSQMGSPESTAALDGALRRGDLLVVATVHEYYLARGIAGKESILIAALEKHGTRPMAWAFLRSGNPLLRGPGEQFLVWTLRTSGTKELAEEFLNSGNSVLFRAAEEWVRVHGYRIVEKESLRKVELPEAGTRSRQR